MTVLPADLVRRHRLYCTALEGGHHLFGEHLHLLQGDRLRRSDRVADVYAVRALDKRSQAKPQHSTLGTASKPLEMGLFQT